MNTITLQRASAAALSLALLMTTSCTAPKIGQTEQVLITKGSQPGLYALETTKVTATVTGIDASSRKVTVVTPEGKKQVITAAPEVRNFDQIKIGDQLLVTLTTEAVVYMAKDGPASPDGTTGIVAIAAKGEKPGIVKGETSQLTAKVIALDTQKHKATAQFADGSKKTFNVRKEVDMTKVSLGEEVVFRYTEAQAILIQKP
jgi:D-arabinose 1-dehydrogenase-like Zn-dependent alcohol dehydrogenase